MKIPVKLQQLLQQPESTIISIGALIGQGLAVVDCTGVDSVTPELLNLIFFNIRNSWDFEQLKHIFDYSTFTDTFNTQLSQYVDQRFGRYLNILKQMFLWGSKTKGLAFRLHQFISQGGSVYATIENRDKRLLTLEGQYKTTEDRLLYPLVFCRECGQDYYVARYDADKHIILPQLPTALDISPDDADITAGYLTLDEPGLWDTSDEDRLPDSWFSETKKKGRAPKKDYARFIPQKLQVLPNSSIFRLQ